MINIIHIDVHCDDERHITAMEIKLKSCPEEAVNESSQHLVARASAAFYSLSLFSEYGKTLKIALNPKRQNVLDMHISFWENNQLSSKEIFEFVHAFQEKLDNSPF